MSRKSLAERAGFEPAIPLQVYTLSRRAPSTTRTPLLQKKCTKEWRISSVCKTMENYFFVHYIWASSLTLMRISLLAVLMVCLFGCAANKKIRPYSYPKPFQFVLSDVSKGNKNYLYIRANQWMVKTFVSAKEVIQVADKDAGKLVGKSFFEIPMPTPTSPSHTDFVYFTISIEVEDGKFRCVLSDFYHEGGPAAKGKPINFGSLDAEALIISGIDHTQALYDTKNKTMDKSKALLSKLKFAMEVRKDDS